MKLKCKHNTVGDNKTCSGFGFLIVTGLSNSQPEIIEHSSLLVPFYVY